jgi:DNA-binding GntR family transcriptional regulator
MTTAAAAPPGMQPLVGETLTSRVYDALRTALMEGAYAPGHPIKIRELAASLHVSETPCREALMQLVRERGLVMRPGHSITVARLTVAQYLELRVIRMELEAMAGEAAALRATPGLVRTLVDGHRRLVQAERAGAWRDAVRLNWVFHRTTYEAADMPELLAIIEGIWLRNGPLLNLLYPDARPTYRGRHQHLNLIDAMRARNPEAVRTAIRADMIEGGEKLLALMRAQEAPAPAAGGGATGRRRAGTLHASPRRTTEHR